jgi:hypothetical protein
MDIDISVDCDNYNPLPSLPNRYADILDLFFEYISPERDSVVEKLWNDNATVRFIYTDSDSERIMTFDDLEEKRKYNIKIVRFLKDLDLMPGEGKQDGRIVIYSIGDTNQLIALPFNNYSNEPVISFGQMLKPLLGRGDHKNREMLDKIIGEYKNSVCLYTKVMQKAYEENTVIRGGKLNNYVVHMLIANRIKIIYVSLMYRLIQMYTVQKNAYRQANATSYLSQMNSNERQIGDNVAIAGQLLNQEPSNFIGVNTKEGFENMDQEAVYKKQFETVVPTNDEDLMNELNTALEGEYVQQPKVPLALPKSTAMVDVQNTGKKIIVQDVIHKKNLQTKLVELRNQVDYLQRVNRVVYYRKLAMYVFIAIVLSIMMYVILR